MSGTVRGVIDGYSNEANEFLNVSNMFKVWFDAFEAHPNMTRVALQYGNGGTGTDFWDGANPFGTNAFAVWSMAATAARPYVYYVALQATNGTVAYGAAPGDPGTHSNNPSGTSISNMAICAAIGVGGDSNPWNGTTNNDGTDRKGGSSALPNGNDGLGGVWRVPVGGTEVLCFPRINNAGGSEDVRRAGSVWVDHAGSPAQMRYDLVMDDDNIMVHIDEDDNGGGRFCFIGPYELHSSITNVTYPFLVYGTSGVTLNVGTVGGGDGGIAMPDGSNYPVVTLNMDEVGSLTSTSQPNTLFTVPQYDLVPMYVRAIEASAGAEFVNGLAGAFGDSNDNFFLWTYNVPRQSTSGSLTRAVLGSATLARTKPSIPWDGATVPGTNMTRAGIAF